MADIWQRPAGSIIHIQTAWRAANGAMLEDEIRKHTTEVYATGAIMPIKEQLTAQPIMYIQYAAFRMYCLYTHVLPCCNVLS